MFKGPRVRTLELESPSHGAEGGQDSERAVRAEEVGALKPQSSGAADALPARTKPQCLLTCRLAALIFACSVASFALGVAAAYGLLRTKCQESTERFPLEAGTVGGQYGLQRRPVVNDSNPNSSARAELPRPAPSNTAQGQAGQVAASYGFVYTPEGMSILDGLLQNVSSGGPRMALKTAERLFRTNRHFLDACHPLLHRLGRIIFMTNRSHGLVSGFRGLIPFSSEAEVAAAALVDPRAPPGRPPAAVKSRGLGYEEVSLLMTCNAAYLHGIIELFLFSAGARGNLEAALRFLNEQVCVHFGGMRPAFECQHGVGHGIAQFKRHVMIKRGISQSLDLGASSGPARTGNIWNGVWMDHFASTAVSGHDADDPEMTLAVCRDREAGGGRGTGDCWMYSPTAFLLHRPRAYVEAITWCHKGCRQDRNCASPCIRGVGMQTFKENLDDMRLVESVCTRSGTFAGTCMSGATGYYHFATGVGVPKALCKTVKRDDLRRICNR